MKELFYLKAEPKEISLVINILNKIYNFKRDWNYITFNDASSIMIPKGYFESAEMERIMRENLKDKWDLCKKCYSVFKYSIEECPMCKSKDIERMDNAGIASFFKLPLKDLFGEDDKH